MKKIITMTVGVVLAASALSAFAGNQDRENLAQCKADVKSYYGEGQACCRREHAGCVFRRP